MHVYERHYALQLFALSFVNRFFSLVYLVVLKKLGTITLFHQATAAVAGAVGVDDAGVILEASHG